MSHQSSPAPVLAVVPAYEASRTVGQVVEALLANWPCCLNGVSVIVVDDGSTDDTAERATAAGAKVVQHATNLGKGAALKTGFEVAWRLGAHCVVTVDSDGQHLPADAERLARHPSSSETLLLGTRDMAAAGAPRLNRFGNRVSNFFISKLGGRRFVDTQCGLRRYPLKGALKAGVRATGYEYETEILLTAARLGWPIVELGVDVVYPPNGTRITHYRNFRDTSRIVARVIATAASVRKSSAATRDESSPRSDT